MSMSPASTIEGTVALVLGIARSRGRPPFRERCLLSGSARRATRPLISSTVWQSRRRRRREESWMVTGAVAQGQRDVAGAADDFALLDEGRAAREPKSGLRRRSRPVDG